jgi:ABC-type polysaccharide/polyol phosphate transport system ATPase subunit
MMARLGFSIAVRVETDLLLIDEVLAVGDDHFRRKAERTMGEKISGKQSFVLVAHNNMQIRRLCERAIWLEGGEVRADGDTESVLAEYEKQP